MDSEIIRLADMVKERTGVAVRIYSDDGNDCYSPIIGEQVEKADGKISGIVCDGDSNKTYFRFRYRADEYSAYIDKIGEEGKTLAGIIVTLFENGGAKEVATSKKDAVKSVLSGESNAVTAMKYMKKYGIPELPCTVYVFYTQEKNIADLINFLENFKSNSCDTAVATDDITCAYVKFNDNGAPDNEYQSIADYACLLEQSIEEELGFSVRIGVGATVGSFADGAISYKQAITAVRMSGLFELNAGVATYKDYVFVKMLEDLPRYKLEEFLSVLSEPDTKTVFSDPEMIETATEFLKANLNVSEASRNLYMHRNTLMYRLDKIERATGLDLRKFQDAMTFRIMTILHKLLG